MTDECYECVQRGRAHPGHVALHEHLAVEALALVVSERALQLRAAQREQLVSGHAELPLRRGAEPLRLQPLHHLVRVRFLTYELNVISIRRFWDRGEPKRRRS